MKWEKFNNSWKVWKDTNPFELVFRVPEEAENIELPYDAMFHEEQREDSVNAGSTGFLDAGEYKYWKTFFVPGEWREQHLFLKFEGIYGHASVFVNQSLAGEHASGYTEFTVEAQNYIRFGAWNEILVSVKCGTQNSRWYSGAGIYRDVWIGHAPAVFLQPESLKVTTREVSEEGAAVSTEIDIKNDSLCPVEARLHVRFEESGGKQICTSSFPIRIAGGKTVTFRKSIFLDHVSLWSDEHPVLYHVSVLLQEEENVLDMVETDTGFRSLMLDARHGLRVNGKTVKLRGACIHHDQSILGAATYDAYEYRRVRLLKEAGFNAVRSAHNHASQALLRACDQLGVYVMDEMTDVWNKSKSHYDSSLNFVRNWKEEVEAMIKADYNHPSVILYSTGNEIFEICTEKGIETSRMLGEEFHRLDPTRYTTNGINGAFAAGDGLARIVKDISGKDPGKGDVNFFMGMMETKMPQIVSHPVIGEILEKLEPTMDILGYNYMTARYEADAEKYPDRVMVGTETYPKQIAENWSVIEKTPSVIGDFTWTGWDYLGEVTPVYPTLCNTGGDLSATGVRRPVSFYREIVFGRSKGPCLAVQDPGEYGRDRNFGPWCFTDCTFRYSYEGMEGRPIMVQVYGGGDTAELFQNGKSLGRKKCGKETGYFTSFDTVYEPGELAAVIYEGEQEVGRSVLRTVEKEKHLTIYAGREKGHPFWIFADIWIQDSHGTIDRTEQKIQIRISGPGELVAFGSEHARHRRGYRNTETTTTDGHALAVIRVTGKGNIRLSVSSEDMATVEACC